MRLIRNFPHQAIASDKVMTMAATDFSAVEMRLLSLYNIGTEAMRLREHKDAEFWRRMYGVQYPKGK